MRTPRVALAAAVLLAALPAAAPAQPRPGPARTAPPAAAPPAAAPAAPAIEADLAARRSEVTALSREVADLTRHIAENRKRAAELTEYGGTLAERVRRLKKSPSGVVRDAQLKDDLKELRRVLATLRNMSHVQRILETTLSTRQVALARKAETEASRLLDRGEEAVRAGRDDDAGREFRAALAMLRLGSGARIGARPPVREPVPEPTGRFALSGHETPDEMRELALLLRDGADKIKWNGALLVEVLGRLRAERETLEDLRALETPRDGPAEGALAELDGHIGQVTAELERLRRLLGGFLARANILEQQADREEVAMLQEAGRAATGVAP